MTVLSFEEIFLTMLCCGVVSSALAISIHKTAGSEYFGILPASYARVNHRSEPPPENEGYQLISNASYYFNRANNQVYDLFRSLFGTSDEEDPQLGQGIYKCDNAGCRKITLDEQQSVAFHRDSSKSKKIKTGNDLTRNVDQTSNSDIFEKSPSPMRQIHRIRFQETEQQRKSLH